MAQVGALLTDPGLSVLRGIIGLEHLGDGGKFTCRIALFVMGQRKRAEFLRGVPFVVYCRMVFSCLDILHIISKLPVQMGEHIGRQILCRHAGFQTGKAADLFRRNRAYTGEACVDSLAKRHGLRSQRLNEGIRAYIQGILLRHGIRYKISPPRSSSVR